MKKINDYENGYDCFGNSGGETIDHIWPRKGQNKEGVNGKQNQQHLTSKSNEAKGNKLSGDINGWHFSITPKGEIDGKVIGKMTIKKDNVEYEVESTV